MDTDVIIKLGTAKGSDASLVDGLGKSALGWVTRLLEQDEMLRGYVDAVVHGLLRERYMLVVRCDPIPEADPDMPIRRYRPRRRIHGPDKIEDDAWLCDYSGSCYPFYVDSATQKVSKSPVRHGRFVNTGSMDICHLDCDLLEEALYISELPDNDHQPPELRIVLSAQFLRSLRSPPPTPVAPSIV